MELTEDDIEELQKLFDQVLKDPKGNIIITRVPVPEEQRKALILGFTEEIMEHECPYT